MGTGLLALLDDIAAVLDDVAVMTKMAAKKTAGVLGDDLALNAEQVSGVRAERELPVVWAVAKGSLINKGILVPSALLISAFIPWLITPLLMLGGAYLCYEGAEKVIHKVFPSQQTSLKHLEITDATNIAALENTKIKGAIRTDFILSAEIIVIALGVVEGKELLTQTSVLVFIALVMTVGVYGLVAAIVKIDDLGFWLYQRSTEQSIQRFIGHKLIHSTPYLMRGLAFVGTIAMFLVGGGIIAHGLPFLENSLSGLTDMITSLPHMGFMGALLPSLFNGVLGGIIGGALVLLMRPLITLFKRK